jgi:hypothetical protein
MKLTRPSQVCPSSSHFFNHIRRCRLGLLIAAALLPFSLVKSVQSQTSIWTNVAGGNFSTPGNWSAGVPSGGATALFNTAGTYTVTLDANSSFGNLTLSGVNSTFQANSVPRLMNISNIFTVSNGAQAVFNAPATTINAGTLTVFGSGSSLSLNGGTSLTSTTTNLGNGAGNSTFIVDGAGSIYTGTGGLHRLGMSNGSNTLMTVRNGAIADFDNSLGSVLRIAGSASNTTATLNVESGATLNAANITLGTPSGAFVTTNGTLNLSGASSQVVQSGASTLTLGGSAASNVGKLNINGGTFTTGTGAFTVESASDVDLNSGTLNANGNLTIRGAFTHQGGQFNLASGRSVLIENNGRFVTSTAVTNTFNNNTLTITGTGSRYTSQIANTSSLVANGSQINLLSNGELTIGNVTLGATTASNLDASASLVAGANFNMLNGSTADFISNSIGSFTNTTVDGSLGIASGSSYTATSMLIGNQANGLVNVNSGTLLFNANSGTALTVGKSSGPTGNLTLTNSSFNTASGGTMLVNATGQVNATNSMFNLQGLLDINGGSFSQTGGSLIGGASQAITVRNGGSFATSNAINLTPLTTLAVTVNGSTSSFQAQSLNLNSLSTLNLNGGTATSNFAFDGGTVNFNSGTLRHTGSLVMDATKNQLLFGPSSAIGAARRMVVDGAASIESPLSLGGGRLSVGSISGGNLLNLDQGTFQLTGSTLTVGGGQFGDVMAINSGLTVETTNAQQSIVASNGRLIVNGGTFGSAGNLTNNGEIQLTSILSTIRGGSLQNNSMILGTGRIENNLQNNALGIIQAHGSDRLVFNGTTNINSGNINATNGARIEFRNSLNNFIGGLISSQDSSLRFDGGLFNSGGLGVTFGASNIFGDITNFAQGIINVSGGGQATFSEDILQNGTMQIVKVGNSTSSAVVFGSFSGSGGFTGGGDLFALGDLRPGNSPASVLYGGNLFMGASTNTFIELGGLSSGQFDQMLVLGDLSLNGDLMVSLIHGHSLAANQSYQIGDIGGSLFGQFVGLNEGALVGNFGGLDLFISYAGGDGNDISLFTAVPEPSSLMLLGVTALGFGCQRRRKQVHAASALTSKR